MRYYVFALALLFSIAAAAQGPPVDRKITLPQGVRQSTVDLGPSGTVGIYHLGGDNYSVVEGRNTYSFTSGSIEWEGIVLATLHCWEKRCVTLPPGNYAAHFLDLTGLGFYNSVSVEYHKSDRHGRPKGKPIMATYSIEWDRWRPDLKNQFLAIAALQSAPESH